VTAAEGAVEFDHVTKRFGGRAAIDDVSLTVEPGRTVCIIGPSGSGKSTLLRLVNRLEAPDSGRVLVGGDDIGRPGYPIEDLRRRIGMVFQQYSLFPHMTVLENVTFALRLAHGLPKGTAVEVALDRLDQVGIAALAHSKPDRISGGERQRAAIARSLAINPAIMLFDEITSALDPELVKGVLALIKEFQEQHTTILVVTHEMRFARESADAVAFMDQGRLVEYGPAETLFDQPQSQRLRDFIAALN
jgi:ABC-type polar amino acid transport system ATPase subunit